MPKYNVDKAFWRGGRLVAVGEKVTMTKAEAKYLGHILSEAKVETAPEAAPAPAAEEVAEPAAAGVTVTEKPVHAKRTKRHAGADNDHASN
ncbi:hypothetical protein J4G48_0040245 [Bradyrhizobium barranii subsp. apii]|uniref:hypothetical protein n=1 Tax=Bradyrhizobium barranii TaxID=2992140 RepID=UPI001AA178CB|nr:hypothetical protein [Bradyrhizobium barranii]UPT95389.1 hypothetical protein J4G48_0040245 [Bradyrhizobium barranii subsp. apii]